MALIYVTITEQEQTGSNQIDLARKNKHNNIGSVLLKPKIKKNFGYLNSKVPSMFTLLTKQQYSTLFICVNYAIVSANCVMLYTVKGMTLRK